jgi:flavodoxin short chain
MSKTLIIYGSLTGNTEGAAFKISDLLQAAGHTVEVKNAVDCELDALQGDFDHLLLACSTWDDGLPQGDFKDFMERVETSELDLSSKKVSMLGLGDSNYVHFCGALEAMEELFIGKFKGQKIIEHLRIDGYPDMEENQQKVAAWVEQLKGLI